ncbi:thioredoxin family protein, partial [Flavobacterium sp.]|uniref:thioredoxin family protein n=1 Tax=Flavobacterium sp. TaxID=239 RepID=UPI0037526D88
ETSQELNALMHEYYWLVLAEGWCGDAAQLVPIFNKMANTSNNVELKLLFRDENKPLMDMFLTNGSRSIPKLIVLEKETLQVKGAWGPRPEGATKLIRSYKQQYGVVDETAKAELQLWYLHDKGLSTQNELTTLMHHLEQLEHNNVRK